MSGFLLGVPGRLKTLLDRLTAARAGNLDEITATRMGRLDTNVASRAPSSATDTLLARLTSGRASNLDEITAARLARLDTNVGSRATNDGVWTNGTRTLTSAPSPIKSIQSGVYEETLANDSMDSRNVTISAVTAAKSVVFVRGGWAGSGSTSAGPLAKAGEGSSYELLSAELTSSTNLRFTPGSSAVRYRLEWTVVEFN